MPEKTAYLEHHFPELYVLYAKIAYLKYPSPKLYYMPEKTSYPSPELYYMPEKKSLSKILIHIS
jgi:hypothetical protein